MPKVIKVSYPVMAQAFRSPVSDEQGPTIDGCSRENCGAWGAGVCRITVEMPDSITQDTPATYDSTTFLSAIGCITCGDMESPQYIGPIMKDARGTIPNELNDDLGDDTMLFKAGNLALPSAISAIQKRTQCEVNLID